MPYYGVLTIASCTGAKRDGISEVSLVETSDTVCFSLPPEVRTYNHSFGIYNDTDGKEYAYFLNRKTNQIFIYDAAGGDPLKIITYEKEGPNGIGNVYSMHMKSWNEFLIPGENKTIYLLDSCATIQKKTSFGLNDEVTGFESYADNPFVLLGDTLYSFQVVRRASNLTIGDSPTEIAINMNTREFMLSPNLESGEIKNYLKGRITARSEVGHRYKCFNGKYFVYSFSYNENLVAMSPDFKDISSKPAISKYIGKLKIPDFPENMDFDEGMRQYCTNPFYGHVVYDPYRKLYYRFAYPETELENKKESWYDLSQSGRNEFSIIVLDEDLNVIGETKFPRNMFRSNLYFVCKDGFYISCNHYKTPGYTEDHLQFVRFELE